MRYAERTMLFYKLQASRPCSHSTETLKSTPKPTDTWTSQDRILLVWERHTAQHSWGCHRISVLPPKKNKVLENQLRPTTISRKVNGQNSSLITTWMYVAPFIPRNHSLLQSLVLTSAPGWDRPQQQALRHKRKHLQCT